MNLTEAIYARRATRAFTPGMVEEPLLRSLLAAAVQAPSAMNTQSWKFAVVQNAAQLRRYSDLAKQLMLDRLKAQADAKASHYREMLGDAGFNIFYDATTLVAIGVDAPTDYSGADCWLAAENLMLAATEAGLGTCCIGFAVPMLNTGDVKRELGFAPGATVFAPIIVGYPSLKPDPVPRKAPQIASWAR
jgi:nitroreductase